MPYIDQNYEEVSGDVSGSGKRYELNYDFPHNLTEEQEALVNTKKLADLIKQTCPSGITFRRVSAGFFNFGDEKEISVTVESSADIWEEHLNVIGDCIEAHMEEQFGEYVRNVRTERIDEQDFAAAIAGISGQETHIEQ